MFSFALLAVLVLGVLCEVAHGRAGVDISVRTTSADWACLKSTKNIEYAIVRMFRNVGQIDSNGTTSLSLALEAGISDLGAYMFPCVTSSAYAISHNITCPSASEQVDMTLKALSAANVIFSSQKTQETPENAVVLNMMWLDIEDESPSKYFDATPSINTQLMAAMVAALETYKVPVGIYSTKTYWQNIMGNIEGYSKYPLWYPRYDNINSMDFFTPFAGWESVLIKQTAGDSYYCDITQVDTDYMEDK